MRNTRLQTPKSPRGTATAGSRRVFGEGEGTTRFPKPLNRCLEGRRAREGGRRCWERGTRTSLPAASTRLELGALRAPGFQQLSSKILAGPSSRLAGRKPRVCVRARWAPPKPPRHQNTFGPSIAVPRNNRAIHGLLSGLALFDASARNKKHTARLLVPKEKHLKAENAVPGLLEPAPSAVQSAARLEASLSVAFPPARRKNA